MLRAPLIKFTLPPCGLRYANPSSAPTGRGQGLPTSKRVRAINAPSLRETLPCPYREGAGVIKFPLRCLRSLCLFRAANRREEGNKISKGNFIGKRSPLPGFAARCLPSGRQRKRRQRKGNFIGNPSFALRTGLEAWLLSPSFAMRTIQTLLTP